MAIYHLRANVISRGKGKSATASAAYQSGSKIEDKRTGLTFDYTRKRGVDGTEIITPNQVPNWVNNRSALWNNAELRETRINSRTAREIEVALPKELRVEVNQELVKQFVKEELVSKGLVADIAFHKMDSHNPHAHIMFTTRIVEEKGFGAKDRSLDKKQWMLEIRESWQTHVNQALKQAGKSERIDHRSLEAQGVNRIPQIHLGANVGSMMKKGIATERGEIYLSIQRANEKIALLEQEIRLTDTKIEEECRVSTVDTVNRENTVETIDIVNRKNAVDTVSRENTVEAIDIVNRENVVDKVSKVDTVNKVNKPKNSSSQEKSANLSSQTSQNSINHQFIPNSQKKEATGESSKSTNQSSVRNKAENGISDAQLISLEKQWLEWQQQQKEKTRRKQQQKEKIRQQIKQLEKKQSKLALVLAVEKQQREEMKPRSLFNPWGDSAEVIKKQEQKLNRIEYELEKVEAQLSKANLEINQWEKDYQNWLNNEENQKMREYSEQRVTPEIASQIERLQERYSLHKTVEYILNQKGRIKNNLRCAENNDYRISQTQKTITIVNKHSGEVIYEGTDESHW